MDMCTGSCVGISHICRQTKIYIQSNGEIDQTHTCLSVVCLNMVLATAFIQILRVTRHWSINLVFTSICYLVQFLRHFCFCLMVFFGLKKLLLWVCIVGSSSASTVSQSHERQSARLEKLEGKIEKTSSQIPQRWPNLTQSILIRGRNFVIFLLVLMWKHSDLYFEL